MQGRQKLLTKSIFLHFYTVISQNVWCLDFWNFLCDVSTRQAVRKCEHFHTISFSLNVLDVYKWEKITVGSTFYELIFTEILIWQVICSLLPAVQQAWMSHKWYDPCHWIHCCLVVMQIWEKSFFIPIFRVHFRGRGQLSPAFILSLFVKNPKNTLRMKFRLWFSTPSPFNSDVKYRTNTDFSYIIAFSGLNISEHMTHRPTKFSV